MSRRATFSYSRALDATAMAARSAQRAAAQAARRAEAERRQDEWRARTASFTSQYLDRYQVILDDIRDQGLDSYVKDDVETIQTLITDTRELTKSDPSRAKAMSHSIGPLVGPLPRAARQRRGESRAMNYQSKSGTSSRDPAPNLGNYEPVAPAESPVETAWREALEQWTDFVSRDLVYVELATLRQLLDTEGGLRTPAEATFALAELRSRAEEAAADLRKREAEVEVMNQDNAIEAPEPDVDINRSDGESAAMVDDAEDLRREAVRGVMNALEDAGFQVESPRLVELSADSNEVVVVGTRPSGVSAAFNITLDGRLEYDFSGYKGSSCDADIDAVVPVLQEVYGIQLTEEVVAWRNPDDEDATARPQPGRTGKA